MFLMRHIKNHVCKGCVLYFKSQKAQIILKFYADAEFKLLLKINVTGS